MKRLCLLVGLFLLPVGAAAAGEGLYDLFRAQVDRELNADAARTDDVVLTFLQGVYRPKWPMSRDEILGALRGQSWRACATPDTPQNDALDCARALENIPALAREEQGLRAFGRTLQRVAVGQELPLSEIPGRPFHIATDLSGIVNIWRAGTGSVRTASGGVLLRTRALSEAEVEDFDEFFGEFLQDHPGGLSDADLPEASSAIAWRYQYGVRLVRGDRAPLFPPPVEDDRSGPGTERQYLFKRWQANEDDEYGIEELLMGIWDNLPKEFDPPLEDNEMAYFLFPDSFHEHFPPGMLLWARVDNRDGAEGGEHPYGDVGLVQELPMDPLLPSLLSIEEGHVGEPILGGHYPPEPAQEIQSDEEGNPLPPGTTAPVDGRGLCSMTLAGRGFLCRPFAVTDETACPSPEGGEQGGITLLSCELDEEPVVTIAGADVCEDIAWRAESEAPRPVCDPGETSEYKNTIGNNACYIGRCVEESLELHRITGGRSPAIAGDSAFPWDAADSGDALATVLKSVPATMPQLPSYRPQDVVRILEDALCQLQGLPAATPPHLCAFSPSQRLDLPLGDRASTAQGLYFDAREEREAALITEQLAAALGSRIGTDVQGQYLRIGTRTLSDVVALANTLLKDMLTVRFPANMCPLTL